jgi:hypothetical protein
MTKWFEILFNPGESACYAENMYGTNVYPVEQIPDNTEFYSLNPLAEHRMDCNVTAHRNFLIEIDSLPLEEQIPYIKSFAMPCSMVTFSGSKSYHFVIALEQSLPSRKAYSYVATWLHNIIKQADHSTKNPSRLTRLPGAIRSEKQVEQKLMYLGKRISLEEFASFLNKYPDCRPVERPKAVRKFEDHQRGELNKFTKWYLNGEAEVNTRNWKLFQAAIDFASCNYTLDETLDQLLEAAVACGLNQREAHSTIQSGWYRGFTGEDNE